MNLRWSAAIVVAIAIGMPNPLFAGQMQCNARSPDYSVALIELFTSEGCDSCPPADRWLSKLNRGGLGRNAVALAMHVDYWDRLGWHDRFSSAAFTQRQQHEAAMQRTGLVYTPQVVVQGKSYENWSAVNDPSVAFAQINARPARARIELGAVPTNGTAKVDLAVEIGDPKDRSDAVVTVALIQSGLVSEVKAGENAGKRLEHDRVVREWHTGIQVDGKGRVDTHLNFALPADAGPLALIAFAENSRTGDVLQALELPLCAAQ